MKDLYLVNYSVKGIKTIDELISLSFYKKTISRNVNTKEYNVKGIYGMNGSGKSAIITSVDILRKILIDPGYLKNPIAQKDLDAIINKKTEELFIEVDFIFGGDKEMAYFRYCLRMSKDSIGKYIISYEKLSTKNAFSKSDTMNTIFEIRNGEVAFIIGNGEDEFSNALLQKTINLLDSTSLCALFYEKFLSGILEDKKKVSNLLSVCLCALFILGKKIYVYLDQSDDHREYILNTTMKYDLLKSNLEIDALMNDFIKLDRDYFGIIFANENYVPKELFNLFKKNVDKLYEFLHIFKSELQGIEIDRKENQNSFICNLVMVYDSYKIHAEFESTGIKKLIKLYAYLKKMTEGEIVFIDEFDSNLHDVYLCALLEYLMEYGEGQLCFTTHNVGPMDILKRNKKSIDFLSVDHKIYPWTTNGNYSPSKLYRNGMIEGSPFNVDSIDFIGVFDSSEEDDA